MAHLTIKLSATPVLIAVGEGNAMIQGKGNDVDYHIGTDSAAPNALPFTAGADEREPMALADGEGLWVSGEGICTYYAEVEPS